MKRFLLLFVTGCTLYPIVEILWRGRTHPSMSLAGGIGLCLIDKTCKKQNKHAVCFHQCALCACIITALEFFFGFFVNIIGKRNVWDYSDKPANFMGQICLPFSIGWFFLSIPMVWICNAYRKSKYLCK